MVHSLVIFFSQGVFPLPFKKNEPCNNETRLDGLSALERLEQGKKNKRVERGQKCKGERASWSERQAKKNREERLNGKRKAQDLPQLIDRILEDPCCFSEVIFSPFQPLDIGPTRSPLIKASALPGPSLTLQQLIRICTCRSLSFFFRSSELRPILTLFLILLFFAYINARFLLHKFPSTVQNHFQASFLSLDRFETKFSFLPRVYNTFFYLEDIFSFV